MTSPIKNRANWPEEEADFSELFPPKMEGPFVYESIRSIRCEKGKPNVIKRSQKPESRSLALADWFARRQNPSFYNKLVTENAVIQVLYIDIFAPGWAPAAGSY